LVTSKKDTVYISYQLIDAKRYDKEGEEEVSEGETSDDTVRQVLQVPLKEHGEQYERVTTEHPQWDHKE